MPSTHSALRYHIIFSAKDRSCWIDAQWRSRLHAYVGGVVRTLDAVALAVGGVADHIHILAGLSPSHRLADFVRDVKIASTKWIHTEMRVPVFSWQEGYGAFTVSPNCTDAVIKYIANQEEHHRTKTFQDEYLEFLSKAGVKYDEKYLW